MKTEEQVKEKLNEVEESIKTSKDRGEIAMTKLVIDTLVWVLG